MLGTASQQPTRLRNHSGYVLLWDDEAILVDPGEGTQRQLLIAGVRPTRITRICITHLHGDHCLGLPGVVALLSQLPMRQPVSLHYPASGTHHTPPGIESAAAPAAAIASRLLPTPASPRMETRRCCAMAWLRVARSALRPMNS